MAHLRCLSIPIASTLSGSDAPRGSGGAPRPAALRLRARESRPAGSAGASLNGVPESDQSKRLCHGLGKTLYFFVALNFQTWCKTQFAFLPPGKMEYMCNSDRFPLKPTGQETKNKISKSKPVHTTLLLFWEMPRFLGGNFKGK